MPDPSAFLPEMLLRTLARGAPSRLPHLRRRPAALLLSDVSGFTALTERLESRGRVGAEAVAAVVNGVFRRAIDAVQAWGGSVLSFGGDALFSAFDGRGAVARGRRAAGEIGDAVARPVAHALLTEPVSLRLTQTLHWDDLEELHVGTDGRREVLFGGPGVMALARYHGDQARGTFASSPAAATRDEGTAIRRRRPTPAVPSASLRPYLPPRAAHVSGGFRGGFRSTTIAFLETSWGGPAEIQETYLWLRGLLDAHHGTLLKTDLSPHGVRWFCAFGLTEAHERDLELAGRFAARLLARPAPVRLRGGLHAGTVANVIIGTRHRCSFEAMGDVVNTAARAASAASWGEVLLTGALRRRLAGMRMRPRGRHELKGKSLATSLWAVDAEGPATPAAREHLPLVGRTAELRRIGSALRRSMRGHGHVLAVTGEVGIGKTRLAEELAERAAPLGVEVHTGACDPFDLDSLPLRAILRTALGLRPGHGEATSARIARATEGLGLSATDRLHLAEILGLREPGSHLAHLAPRTARLNSAIAFRNLLLARSRRAAQLVIVDNAHDAGPALREAIAVLARSLGGARILVLVLSRPGGSSAAPAETIRLAELPAEDASRLLASAFGPLAPGAAAMVLERAAGNPFYIEEIARHLQEVGGLLLGASGARLRRPLRADDLPASLEAVIQTRLDALPAGATQLAQTASVIGREVPRDLLAAVASSRDVDDVIAILVDRGILSRSGPGAVAFRHPLTRDAAYASILVARRRTLHRCVASAIERLPPATRDAHVAALAEHWRRAGSPARARPCFLAAARRAVAAFAPEEAARLYGAFLELRPPRLEAARARVDQAQLLVRAGRQADALDAAREAAREASRAGDANLAGRAMVQAATALRGLGRLEEAEAAAVAAEASAGRAVDASLRASLRSTMGVIKALRGDAPAARDLFTAAHAIHTASGQPVAAASVLSYLANLHLEANQPRLARRLYERVLPVLRRHGELVGEGVVLGNLANTYAQEGRWSRAAAVQRQALRLRRRVGDRVSEAIGLGNLAGILRGVGRHAEAMTMYRECLALQRDVGSRHGEASVLGNIARLLADEGRLLDARKTVAKAVALARDVGDPDLADQFASVLATILTGMGRTRRARALARKAAASCRSRGDAGEEAEALLAIAEAWHVDGRGDRALSEAARALALIEPGDRSATACRALLAVGFHGMGRGYELDALARLASRARAIAGAAPDLRVECACVEGLLSIARGRSGGPSLASAEALAESGGPMPMSVQSRLDALRRATAPPARVRPAPGRGRR